MQVTVSMRTSKSRSTTKSYPLRPVLFHSGLTLKMLTSMGFPYPAENDIMANVKCTAKHSVCISPSHWSRRSLISFQEAPPKTL